MAGAESADVDAAGAAVEAGAENGIALAFTQLDFQQTSNFMSCAGRMTLAAQLFPC